MINVNDRNLTNSFFEGTFQGQSEVSKDPFESIFNSKIKNTAQLFKEGNFQIENKYKSNVLNSTKKMPSHSVLNISSIKICLNYNFIRFYSIWIKSDKIIIFIFSLTRKSDLRLT